MTTLAELDSTQRELAECKWKVLRPHVEDGVPLVRAAEEAGVSLRSAQRWLARYRTGGLAGLARAGRADQGCRHVPAELVGVIEGLALRRPKPSVATITRRATQVAVEQGWSVPSYSTVYAIVADVDPQLLTLAHEGPTALPDRYELVYRRQSDRPNALWQADHTELDLLIVDGDATPARPWLTVVLDDCSRAVAGYTVFLGAPSALNLCLALRQAIWRKSDPAWAVHGIPDVLYADHGSDFTSDHLVQVAADLHIEVVHSTVARPLLTGQSRGTSFTGLSPSIGRLNRRYPGPERSSGRTNVSIGRITPGPGKGGAVLRFRHDRATSHATWAKSGCSITTASCVGRSAPSTPGRPSPSKTSRLPAPLTAAPCAAR